ncbi:MAG: hypothetical protein J7621_22400 [Niastella sp.]|nr:hypothetical protein [Niastella sp.]
MPLIEEKFDQHKVDSLKRYLQREAEKDRPKDYEIMIDGFRVVSRTSDIKEFDDYEQELRGDNRNLSILVFDGPGTNRNTRYSFALQGDTTVRTQSPTNGLGEIEQVIADKLAEREREIELQQLKDQLKTTKAQLTESEEYAEILQKRIKDMEAQRYTHAVSIGEVASVVLKTIVKQHAAKIPGGQALAGLLGADMQEELPAPIPEETPASVSFEKQPEQEPVDEQTRNRLSLIAQMQERFNEQQMIAAFTILDALAAAPDKIDSVLALLGLQSIPAA